MYELLPFNPHARVHDEDWKDVQLVNCTEVRNPSADNMGLHFFQKIRRAAGLELSGSPRPYLFPERRVPYEVPTICCSFDVGRAATYQSRVHPTGRPREFYPEHHTAFQCAVRSLSEKFRFIEIGKRSYRFDNVANRTNLKLSDCIEVMSRCCMYFGMHSGIMHLAAALQIPSIIVINIPEPEYITFPYVEYVPDIDWLYPQNTHLHDDRRGGGVDVISYASIVETIHEVYSRVENQHRR